MFEPTAVFGGYSVDDIEAAKEFYGTTLGLPVTEMMGGVQIELPGGSAIWVYGKPDHQPASYTTANFVVPDIAAAVQYLTGKGITFELYEGMHQDEQGIARGKAQGQGPDIAWFKDPAGNILAVLES
jgi:catechol 2,3-dioxygenase-like lactoylglutathione lyase family enzyme